MRRENEKKMPSDCEKMVLAIIWDADHDISMQEIRKECESRYGMAWKEQTVSTFLARLRNKGFLGRYHEGRVTYYQPLIDRETYRKEEVKILVERFYGGDYQKLIDEVQKL